MCNNRTTWKLFALGLAAGLATLAVACTGGGPSQSEFDALKTQVANKNEELAALQARQGAASPTAAATATTAASPAPTSPAFLQYPGAPMANIGILGAIPNAPTRAPRPTATPVPAGVTPPPPPTPEAPPVVTVPFYAYVDTVTAGPGESQFNVDGSLSCVKTSLFTRGMHIVWRMEVVDTATGKILTSADATAKVRLPSGEELTMRYGKHGGTTWFWTAAWDVPMDYPLGALVYTIDVTTNDGKKVTIGDPLPVTVPNYKGDMALDTRLMIVPIGGG